MVHEHAAHHVGVTFGTGLEEERRVLGVPLLDFGLQGTPAGEAMLSRDG